MSFQLYFNLLRQEYRWSSNYVNTSFSFSVSLSLFFNLRLFTCAYIVWVIAAPYPPPHPSLPHPLSLPGRICSSLISNFVGEKTKAIIRETKRFC
jgi:hypothetical protein